MGGASPLTLDMPLTYNPLFPKGLIGPALCLWDRLGCAQARDLYIHGECIIFNQLQIDYGIPEGQRLYYYQLRNFFKTKLPTFPAALLPKSLLQKLLELAGCRRKIMTIYNELLVWTEP